MKTYLVTGAAGFIGANFIKHMLAKYDDIKIVVLDLLTYAGNLGMPGITNWWPSVRAEKETACACGNGIGFSRARWWTSSSRGKIPSPRSLRSSITKTGSRSR